MRSFFRSDCAALFVGPAPAYQSHHSGNRSFLRKITKVQSVSYGFDVSREEIKQIGHNDLLTRKVQFISDDNNLGSDIDINIEPLVNFSFEYLPTCGLNEYLLNFNVVRSGEPAENCFLSRHHSDKNFFLVLRSDRGKQANSLEVNTDYYDHYVMGIGNAFATNYAVSAKVGTMTRASLSYQASNVKLDLYSGNNYIPAIDLDDGQFKEEHNYIFGTTDHNNEYSYPGLTPNSIDVTIENTNVGGVLLDKNNANATAFDINLDIQRQALYGFGSMYPHDRKINFPARGSLNLDIIKRDIETGNLNQILKQDKTYKIFINCKSSCNPTGNPCLNEKQTLTTYVIDNAVLRNKNTSLNVKNIANTTLSFDFTVSQKNGFLISGGCLTNAPGSNDPIPIPGRPPIIGVTPSRTPSVTPSITPSISISPTVTPSISATPSVTPSVSVSQTNTPTPSTSQTATPTTTPSISVSITPTPSVSISQTATPTTTPSVSVSITPTKTPTTTITPTQTPSVSITPTVTSTPNKSPSATPSITVSATPTPTPSMTPCTGNSFVRFQYQSTYLVEGTHTGVKVLRDTDLCGPGDCYPNFSVDYTTESANLSAVAGEDYISGSGTLTFNRGDTEQFINITGIPQPGVKDGEKDEFFYIKLYNPRSHVQGVAQITGVNPYSVFIVEPS
jgi:hypothetical protein